MNPGAPTGWQRLIAILAAAVIAVVAAFAVGRITAPETPAPTTMAAPAATTTTTTTTATTTTTTTLPPTTTTTTTTTIPVELEPVARIAAQVGPAVVQLETRVALGSGVIYDSGGYILTAAHVLENVDEVTVRMADGSVLNGLVIGTHEKTDIAVVKIETGSDFPTADLAIGADLRVGQLAVALGSPFGFGNTVTAGIVSAVDRSIDGVTMVQTDAAINPGNSGGPLVDVDGRVIGINDLIFTYSGTNEGVGFAISIDLAVMVATQLVAGEDVELAYLGVAATAASGDIAGAFVEQVIVGSPAGRAGIEVGDLIIALDGEPIDNAGRLRVKVIEHRPGDRVELTVIRDEETLTITVTLASADD
jgi:S1-C subfamily serine protease